MIRINIPAVMDGKHNQEVNTPPTSLACLEFKPVALYPPQRKPLRKIPTSKDKVTLGKHERVL